MDVDYKCLYVKGLDYATTENDLRPLFEATGPVNAVKKISRATAIVSYTDTDHARNAIERLEGSRLHGRIIHVDFKKKKTNQHGPNQARASDAYGSSELSESIPIALHVLRYISADNSTKRVLKNLKAHVSHDWKNSCICIRGDRGIVDEATREIEQLAGSAFQSNCSSSDIFRQCFRRLKYAEFVGVFKSNGIAAGWDLHDGQLHTCSDSVQSARRSLELIRDMIFELKYPTDKELSSAQMSLVAGSKWVELRDRLKEEDLTKSLEIGYDHSLKKVVFAVRSEGNSGAVILALEQFFDPVSGREESVAIDAETAQLFAKNKSSIQKRCCQEGVTIDFNQLLSLCRLSLKSSSNDLLDSAISKLNNVIKQIVKETVSFSKLSTVEWLKSSFGRSKLADITSLTHTVSETKTQRVKQRLRMDNVMDVGDMKAAGALPSYMVKEKPKSAHRVQIVRGDISSVEVDGLVSCHGAVAKAISRKYGVSPKRGFQQVPGGLRVYHIHLEEWSPSEEGVLLTRLGEEVKKACSYMRLYQAKAIAFPAIGTGGFGYPPEKVASTILEALMTSLDDKNDLTVSIVIHPLANVHKVFEDELEKHKPKPSPQTVFSPVVTDVVVEKLTITFTGLKETDATKAISKLQEEIKHGITFIDWGDLPSDKAMITKLTGDEVSHIRTQARKNNVDADVDVSKGIIVLEGIKDHVNMTRDFVNNILRGKSSTVSHNAFPSHWDQQALAKGQHEVKLDRYSEEYSRVSCKFFETCQIVDIQISEITRIQNEHLYTQYEAQKSKMKRELSGDKTIEIERELWHGTTAESVKQICANEFNRSFAGAHGMTYGQGSYFSTSSEYSVSYSEGQVDRYMILAKVATGRYQRGSRDTQRKNLPARIHSTVNSQSNPTIFVVYHDASAYPEYVIRFTKKKKKAYDYDFL